MQVCDAHFSTENPVTVSHCVIKSSKCPLGSASILPKPPRKLSRQVSPQQDRPRSCLPAAKLCSLFSLHVASIPKFSMWASVHEPLSPLFSRLFSSFAHISRPLLRSRRRSRSPFACRAPPHPSGRASRPCRDSPRRQSAHRRYASPSWAPR